MKKLLLHIPHASVVIPFYDGYINDQLKIEKEQLKLTDWYTDELFFSSSDALIKAPFSRIFCDVERFENDADEVMSKYGMGAVYTHFDSGELMREVTPNLRNSIMQEYYWKHHNEFTFAVSNELEKNGTCLIVDCHSYPSTPITRDLNQSPQRPDFNIGIDGKNLREYRNQIGRVCSQAKFAECFIGLAGRQIVVAKYKWAQVAGTQTNAQVTHTY